MIISIWFFIYWHVFVCGLHADMHLCNTILFIYLYMYMLLY